MKNIRQIKWIIIATVALLSLLYIAAYIYLPDRDSSRWRNAEVFVHTRIFKHDWQVTLFYPAAYIESLLIRAYPTQFCHPSSWADYPQALLIQADMNNSLFPHDAFEHH